MTEPRRRGRGVWSALAVMAILWPAGTIGLFDGMPFDNGPEAILLGMAVPVLWWFDRSIFDRSPVRLLVAGLLTLKVVSTVALTQGGLCTEFRAERPVVGRIQAIQFDDETGDLPSWDVRARWRRDRCSAITARPYRSQLDFPAWFVNLLDNAEPPQSRVMMRTSGAVVVSTPGTFGLLTGSDMDVRLSVDGRPVASTSGGRAEIALDPGTHLISVAGVLTGSRWMFVPSWNGADLWRAAAVTVTPPDRSDALVRPWIGAAIAVLVVVLLAVWVVQAIRRARLSNAEWVWIVAGSIALAWLGGTPFGRPAVLLLFGVLLLPSIGRRANTRGAFLLVGVPWLALFAGSSLNQIGQFSIYTRGNDWLTYQISAYRIYLFGYWFEAGERTFFYQPLYRWICGAWHLIFGDSSVGELYWDAACLLTGALLALHVAKRAGRRWAIAAAAATLSIAALGPVWYLIGRGLAEISAAGFAASAGLWLLRARHGSLAAAAVAGMFGVLVYYSRLNHMLFAGGLLALALPLRVEARQLREFSSVIRRIDVRVAAVYVAVLAAGLVLLATRTWSYGGSFSVFQGTSLALNYTGMQTAKILHSVFATLIGNESFDVRGVPILVGVLAALLAVLQVPGLARLPLGPALACLSGVAGAFIAHAHGYPGRFSVHLLPMTTALLVGAASVFASRSSRGAVRNAGPAVLTSPAAADRAP